MVNDVQDVDWDHQFNRKKEFNSKIGLQQSRYQHVKRNYQRGIYGYTNGQSRPNISNNRSGYPRINNIESNNHNHVYSNRNRPGCYNCGEFNHRQANCRFDHKIRCNVCYEYGHKSRLCQQNIHH